MKKITKNYALLTCLTTCLAFSAIGAANSVKVASAKADVSATITMQEGAGLLLKEESGLRFSYTVSNYSVDAGKNYGMLIVPYDYLEKAGISLDDEIEDDYVTALKEAYDTQAIAYEPIVKENLTPIQEDGKYVFKYSVKNIDTNNYVRQYFGIGFEKTADGKYVYATQDDNVRSVFEVANKALNKLNYGTWTDRESDQTEKANLLANEKSVLNPFITTGWEFVYGTETPKFNVEATYIEGEASPVITAEKLAEKANVTLNVEWHYDFADKTVAEMTNEGNVKGLTRGQTAITASIGTAYELETTASILKDETELQIYNDSGNAYFFETVDAPVVNNTYTVKMNGGYYKATNRKSPKDVTGYLALKNPDSADGKYALEAGKGWSLDFYFKGNNMPNVEFFADKISSTVYKEYNAGRKGYLVTNGLGTEYLYARYNALTASGLTTAYTSDADKDKWNDWAKVDSTACTWGTSDHKYNGVSNYDTSFFQYGVTAYDGFTNDADNKASLSFAARDEQTEKSQVWYNSKTTGVSGLSIYHSDFSMESLMKDETKEWHYVVGMYLDASNNVNVESYLYEIANGVETSKASFTKTVEPTTEARNGYIVVHSALKGVYDVEDGNYIPTHLAYTMPKQITK